MITVVSFVAVVVKKHASICPLSALLDKTIGIPSPFTETVTTGYGN
jgi:hypothetical protein